MGTMLRTAVLLCCVYAVSAGLLKKAKKATKKATSFVKDKTKDVLDLLDHPIDRPKCSLDVGASSTGTPYHLPMQNALCSDVWSNVPLDQERQENLDAKCRSACDSEGDDCKGYELTESIRR